MEVLYQTATWLIALPDSVLGVALSSGVLLLVLIWSSRWKKRKSAKPLYSDSAAIAYVVVQCVTLLITRLPSNTIHFIIPYIFSLNIYIALRILSRYPLWSTYAAVRVLLLVAILIGVSDLAVQLPSIRAARLLFHPEALSGIRAVLPIIGGPTRNDGLALVLSLLPVAYAAATVRRPSGRVFRITGVLAAGFLSAVLAIGFSRSIYISLALFVAGCAFLAIRKRRKPGLQIMTVLLASGMVAAAGYWTGSGKAVVDTLLGDRTVSQHRSTVGRAAIWYEVANDIYSHPILGYGGGVNGLMTLRRLRTHDEPFTAHTYNAGLSVLLNSGIMGGGFYAIMLGYPLLATFRANRKQTSDHLPNDARLIFALGVCTLIVRDMTYSSLVDSGAVICVAWMSIAILGNILESRSIPSENNNALSLHHLGWASLLIPAVIAVPLVRTVRGETAYYAACNSLAQGDYAKAHEGFQAAISWNSQQPMFYAADSLALGHQMLDSSSADESWLHPSGGLQGDLLRTARSDLEQALKLSNDDASFWCNLAWVERLQGDNTDAALSLKEALQRDPRDPVALISSAVFHADSALDGQTIDEYAAAVSAYPRLLDSPLFQKIQREHADAAQQIVQRADKLLFDETDSPIRSGYIGKLYAYESNSMAQQELRKAVDSLPDLPYAWANMGALELAKKEPAQARENLERARYLDPSNRLAVNMLAELNYENGDIDRAERLYAQALLLPEQSPHALRIWRLYHVRPPVANDLILPALLPYISPGVTPIKLCDPSWLDRIENSAGHSTDVSKRIEDQIELCRSQ